jgi:hypothetical protein
MEAEIESLLKPGNLKHDASEESRRLKALAAMPKARCIRAACSAMPMKKSRRTRETGIATRDYAQEHPGPPPALPLAPWPAGGLPAVQAQLSALPQLGAAIAPVAGAPVCGAPWHPQRQLRRGR